MTEIQMSETVNQGARINENNGLINQTPTRDFTFFSFSSSADFMNTWKASSQGSIQQFGNMAHIYRQR